MRPLKVGRLAAESPELALRLYRAGELTAVQARGRALDRRSDVWSFGCVLFECLTGRAAFTGETVSDLIARILEREPDWPALPAGTPPRVRELLRRCLRKDADARPRDIRDVRLELAEVGSGRAKCARAPRRASCRGSHVMLRVQGKARGPTHGGRETRRHHRARGQRAPSAGGRRARGQIHGERC